MNNIAIIPARGGSKRIPRKNIKNFLGKPIIAYAIDVALKCGLFSDVVVSTDDDEIAKVAAKYGATVPFLRSTKNSGDFAGTIDVIYEVINWYNSKSHFYDFACCIYPTAPFITESQLLQGLNLMIAKDFLTVFPIVPYSYPIQRSLIVNEIGYTKMIWPEHISSRTQDLPESFHDAGQWYWINLKSMSDKLFTDKSGSIILSNNDVQDIDTLNDWEMAEIKYKNRKNNNTNKYD